MLGIASTRSVASAKDLVHGGVAGLGCDAQHRGEVLVEREEIRLPPHVPPGQR
jgi:hypothetical protein